MGSCRLHEVDDIDIFYLIQHLEQLKFCLFDTTITPAMIMHLTAYLIRVLGIAYKCPNPGTAQVLDTRIW